MKVVLILNQSSHHFENGQDGKGGIKIDVHEC